MELVRKKVHYLNWTSSAKNCLVDLTLDTNTAGSYSGSYDMNYLAALLTPRPLMGSSNRRITILLGSCFIKQPWILNASPSHGISRILYGFWKPEYPGKPLGAKKKAHNKCHLHLASKLGLGPRPHRCAAISLTTMQPLLPLTFPRNLFTRKTRQIQPEGIYRNQTLKEAHTKEPVYAAFCCTKSYFKIAACVRTTMVVCVCTSHRS